VVSVERCESRSKHAGCHHVANRTVAVWRMLLAFFAVHGYDRNLAATRHTPTTAFDDKTRLRTAFKGLF